jgi:hypothetical protein
MQAGTHILRLGSAVLLRDAALRSLDIMLGFPARSGLQIAMSDLIAQAELSLRVWKEIILVRAWKLL